MFEADLAALDAMAKKKASAPSGDRGDDYDLRSRRSAAARGLMDIADADGDVDEATKQLLKAKRPADALGWLDRRARRVYARRR